MGKLDELAGDVREALKVVDAHDDEIRKVQAHLAELSEARCQAHDCLQAARKALAREVEGDPPAMLPPLLFGNGLGVSR